MFTGALLSILLLVAVVGIVVVTIRAKRHRAYEDECRKIQLEEVNKLARDREAIAKIREKLKAELPNADPSVIVRDLSELDPFDHLLVEQLPDLPDIMLYEKDLKPVPCPDFYAYKYKGPEADKANAA